MALILPRSVFFHIPKTGGTWVRQAIKNAGISTRESGSSSDPILNHHNGLRQVQVDGRFTFAFVRHPVAWYASFWSFRMRMGWKAATSIDCFMSVSFDEFIRNSIRHQPGYLSHLYDQYAGKPPRELDFIGRTENLASDLARALRLAGEEFDEEKLLQTPPGNVSAFQPRYSERLREALLRNERNALERFGYS